MNRAGAACAAVANQLGAGKTELIAQHAEQRDARLGRDLHHLPIDVEFEGLRAGAQALEDAIGTGSGVLAGGIGGRNGSAETRDRGGGRAGAFDEGAAGERRGGRLARRLAGFHRPIGLVGLHPCRLSGAS